MTLWIVGQVRSGQSPDCVWDFQGVFDSYEKAIAACVRDNYFVAPAVLNDALPHETEKEWPGAYYPPDGSAA